MGELTGLELDGDEGPLGSPTQWDMRSIGFFPTKVKGQFGRSE
jgi:hypothetical protein